MKQRHTVHTFRGRPADAFIGLVLNIALAALLVASTGPTASANLLGGSGPASGSSQPQTPAVQPYIPGDINGDGVVDIRDLRILEGFIGKPASMCPACDVTHDSVISVADARTLVTLCTYPRCAIEPNTPITISETFESVPGLVGHLLSISPNGVATIPTGATTATFSVAPNHTQYVQIKDSGRPFGWLAVWPSWFTLNPKTPIGPLSTAAAMVFIVPGIFTDELQQQDSYMKILLALPQISALSNALQMQAETNSPITTSAVKTAYNSAIVAAFRAIGAANTASTSIATPAFNSTQSAQFSETPNVDPSVTELLDDQIWLSTNEQTLMPEWTGTALKPSLLDNYGLNEDMYSLGVVYPVETSAYSTEQTFAGLWGDTGAYNPFFSATTLQAQPSNPSAVVLASPTPQGTFILDPAYNLWDAIGNISTLIPLVDGNLSGATEVDSTGFSLPPSTADYVVHMYTCAAGTNNPNTNAELNLIGTWDNGTAALEFADSCLLNVSQFALAELSDLIPNVGIGPFSTATFTKYFLQDLSAEIGNNPNEVPTAVGALSCAILDQVTAIVENVGNYYCIQGENVSVTSDYISAIASLLNLSASAAQEAGNQVASENTSDMIVQILEAASGKVQNFLTDGITSDIENAGRAATYNFDSRNLEPWQGALVQVGNPWTPSISMPPQFAEASSASGNSISLPFVYDAATAPATAVILGAGATQYFYVGSTAGGSSACGCVGAYGANPMTNMTWSPDLNVDASASGNRSISIGRSTSPVGSYVTPAGNHGIAGVGLSGYYVVAHDSEFTGNGTTITVPFSVTAGDIALIAVGGQGTGDIVLSGIPAEAITDKTYSEAGSNVIASEAFYASTSLSPGEYFATLSSTTFGTNSSAAIGAVVYILAPN